MNRVAMVLTAASLLARLAYADDVPRFGIFQKSFCQTGSCENPYKQVTAAAMLRRPDGKEWVMPLFWDGNSAWTFRVSPDAAQVDSIRLGAIHGLPRSWRVPGARHMRSSGYERERSIRNACCLRDGGGPAPEALLADFLRRLDCGHPRVRRADAPEKPTCGNSPMKSQRTRRPRRR